MYINPLSVYFNMPATDPLGKNAVMGKLRFEPEHVVLSWRLKGSVFTGGKGEMTSVELPYCEIESIEVKKGWFKIKALVLRLADPHKVKDMPSAEVGKLELEIDKRSKEETKLLKQLIDFKKSQFILDSQQRRLKAMRETRS